jgi:hypothetical protein
LLVPSSSLVSPRKAVAAMARVRVPADVTATIDPAVTHQVLEGFGAAVALMQNCLSEPLQQRLGV